eukprot:TRINITY_DN27184_c0_g1_i2.p1 TRINITY_DN27184_c0_g1~~TRINITY_DN27184_c0_g1_i2.p1  ORF type:complete len:390 (-),score=80.48 TRINITY_DN27184_c0_g1_i2:186-1355(-)
MASPKKPSRFDPESTYDVGVSTNTNRWGRALESPRPTICTALTSLLNVTHPIMNAPMCGMAMGKLAGAVARTGAVGLIGAGCGKIFDPNRIRAEHATAIELAEGHGAVGFGFLECFMDDDDATFQACLDLNPDLMFLGGFSKPGATPEPWITRIRDRCNSKVVVQAFTVEDAVTAASLGADAVVLQGTDAGGHGRQYLNVSIVALVPQAIAALRRAGFSQCVVVAAGGIATGNQMAAALALGAAGVSMGSAFVVVEECQAKDEFKQRILDTEDGTSATVPSGVWDVLDPMAAPFSEGGYVGRALKDSDPIRRFAGADTGVGQEDSKWYTDACKRGDCGIRAVWCSTSVGLTEKALSAAELIERTMQQAVDMFAGVDSHFKVFPGVDSNL